MDAPAWTMYDVSAWYGTTGLIKVVKCRAFLYIQKSFSHFLLSLHMKTIRADCLAVYHLPTSPAVEIYQLSSLSSLPLRLCCLLIKFLCLTCLPWIHMRLCVVLYNFPITRAYVYMRSLNGLKPSIIYAILNLYSQSSWLPHCPNISRCYL